MNQQRRTGRGFLIGAAVFFTVLILMVLIVPDAYAWVGTVTALIVGVLVGRTAANPTG